MTTKPGQGWLVTTALLSFGLPALAQESVTGDLGTITGDSLANLNTPAPYSPYAGRNFPTRPLFGETHLHTAISLDAGAAGARLGPTDAYRFAKGEQMVSNTGQPVKLARPLDFLVVTDHSDNMGLMTKLQAGDPEVLKEPKGREWYEMMQSGRGTEAAVEMMRLFGNGEFPQALLSMPGKPVYSSTWDQILDAAEEANEPGRFSAIIGYEWTSLVDGSNLHRNVIYRDGADLARQMEPMVTTPPWGSPDPVDLWKWLQAYEDKTGGDVTAIGHNGNLSNGLMFPVADQFGKPVDAEYAATRAKWERLYEITQSKGTSEVHPSLAPTDEFANFEIWDKGNLNLVAKTTSEMMEFNYARAALKNGLKLESTLGTNPYKFGLVGSTDSHTALSTAEEDNFFGKAASGEPSAHRAERPFMKTDIATVYEWEIGASGLAVVWAAENTRAAIFDAMQRRETYATTGTRMAVRFFGGFDFVPEDANNRMPGNVGYTKGVPMGGDLSGAPEGKAPTFLVAALKDPIGANLDRIQIIKGWLDAEGNTHEMVYDVVWGDADTRQPDAGGKLPAVGSTVDVANASWTNTIGDPELITVWTDPDFDPALKAFYYARVIEIPTPRWTAYDAKHYGLALPDEIPMETQERGYTSPIWYTPAG
jgi:hypothetical protein